MEEVIQQDMSKYTSLAEYFADYPEDEDGYYDDMAEMAHYDEYPEYPEDYCA